MIRKVTAFFLIIAVLLSAAGCSRKSGTGQAGGNGDGTQSSRLEHVDLVMYLLGSEPADMDIVLEELNKKAEADLNCTLSIEWIGWGDFTTQYPLVLSSGEQVDLIYAATWLDFTQNAQKGAFLPLEDLLPEYAPKSWSVVSEAVRKQATVDGHMYALPANYKTYNSFGPIVRGDLMEKYHIPDILSFDDYISFLDTIASNEDLDPSGLYSAGMELDNLFLLSRGYYPLTGASESPYWIRLGDDRYTVYFKSECPDMVEFLSNAEAWCNKGYWSRSVLANKDETMLESGLAASRVHNFDTWIGEYGKNLDYKLRYFNLAAPTRVLSSIQDAMAVPASSKHPDRALMLLEKLRNDESYYMLLTYGIEGVHYTITEESRINFLNPDYGNEPGTWGFREAKYKRDDASFPNDGARVRSEIADSAIEVDFTNYNMNIKPIKTEYTVLENVIAEYYNPLKLGYVSYQEGMAELKKELAIAGNDIIKLELKKQLNEFLSEWNRR